MSIIRFNSDRRYFHGKSETYIYHNGHRYFVHGTPTHEDWWECVLRSIARTDLDQESFEEVVEAVQDHAEAEIERWEDDVGE